MRKYQVFILLSILAPIYAIAQNNEVSRALRMSGTNVNTINIDINEPQWENVVSKKFKLKPQTFDMDSASLAAYMADNERQKMHYEKLNRIPKPAMAAWIAALFPGAGQIYNRQYWKLPIIYGGFAGLGYAVSWNNQMYVDYRKAYTDLCSSDPNANYYERILPPGVKLNSSNIDYYKRTFRNKMEGYQRNRDLSIIGIAVLYMLSLIDSYVDAQLRDYDVSPNLSMHIGPTVIPPSIHNELSTSVGMGCKLKF
ncbi:MAG: DUF5683 domain-containing protein [Paludibacteraceae bacterium]|nr:DUF5683 domain-containing protein [Paludibacteraceae bacterium]